MNATAKKTINLKDAEAIDLSDHDFIRFKVPDSTWKWIDIHVVNDGLIISSDIGEPLRIEMSSANQFVVKYPQERT